MPKKKTKSRSGASRAKKTSFGSFQTSETDAILSQLDLFHPDIVEKKIIARKNCNIRTISTLKSNVPLEIVIPPEGDYFIDSSSFLIHADLKIKKKAADGTIKDLEATDETKVAPLNLFSKCLFEDIRFDIQSVPIDLISTQRAYPIKAFIETIASYGQDAAKGHLRCSYWLPDKPAKYADSPVSNKNFKERHKFIAESKNVQICDILHTELTSLSRYIVPGLNIKFKFSLNKIDSMIQTTDDTEYLYELSDFYLSFDRILLDSELNSKIETKMISSGAVYPINRGIIRSKGIDQGTPSIRWQGLYTGTLPDMVTVFMIDTDAVNGAIKKSIFNFQHYNLTEINLTVNSVVIPADKLKIDFQNDQVVRAYRHFFDNIGINFSNYPCLIDYEKFCNGMTLIPFDLTGDKCAQYHTHEKRHGAISLDIQFANPLPKNITIFALCNYNDEFYIKGDINNRLVWLGKNVIY